MHKGVSQRCRLQEDASRTGRTEPQQMPLHYDYREESAEADPRINFMMNELNRVLEESADTDQRLHQLMMTRLRLHRQWIAEMNVHQSLLDECRASGVVPPRSSPRRNDESCQVGSSCPSLVGVDSSVASLKEELWRKRFIQLSVEVLATHWV